MKKIKKVAGYILNFIWNLWTTVCILAMAFYAVDKGRPVLVMSYILLAFVLVFILRITWDKKFLNKDNSVDEEETCKHEEQHIFTESDIIEGLTNYAHDLEEIIDKAGLDMPDYIRAENHLGKVHVGKIKVEKKSKTNSQKRRISVQKSVK